MLRPFSEVVDIEARLGPVGRQVDPVFQHCKRHYVGFVRDLVSAGSIEFVEDTVEHVGLFSGAKRAGAQRLIVKARASNRHFSETSIWAIAHRRRTFVMSNSRRRLWTLRTGLSVRLILTTRSIRCSSLDGCRHFLPCPLFSHLEFVTQEKRSIDRRRLALDSLIYPVPTTLPLGFSWVMCFCQDVTDKCTLAGSADSPLFVGRDHSAPPLLGSKHGTGSVGFR